MSSPSFKDFLYKLVDDALPDEEKKKKKGKKDEKDLPLGFVKYLQLANSKED